jgi:hypothetical protein
MKVVYDACGMPVPVVMALTNALRVGEKRLDER